jgi:hypothetical protein
MNKPTEQRAGIRIALSLAGKLAEAANDADIESITKTFETLAENPWRGVAVPFASSDLKDIFVIKTPDGKWLILYRIEGSKNEPSGKELLIVDLVRANDV